MTLLVLWLAGCGLPACQDLCDARVACVGGDVDASGSTWEEWTGFSSESAYRDACVAEWEASLDDGASRGDLQDLCRAEQSGACD